MKSLIKYLICGFSITFDGTPAFVEADVVIIRVITKDYHILELLVKCNLFSKKLNGIELGNHIVSTITNRYGKSLKDWVAAQQDRASTNRDLLELLRKKLQMSKFVRIIAALIH